MLFAIWCEWGGLFIWPCLAVHQSLLIYCILFSSGIFLMSYCAKGEYSNNNSNYLLKYSIKRLSWLIRARLYQKTKLKCNIEKVTKYTNVIQQDFVLFKLTTNHIWFSFQFYEIMFSTCTYDEQKANFYITWINLPNLSVWEI